MQIFLSHYSGEQSDAEDIADHLKEVFADEDINVFLASSWESVAPGDAWEKKLMTTLKSADALLVLMSLDALQRVWLNFEVGVAWAMRSRILIFCHKGLTPSALPRPYSSLQAVDLNNLKPTQRLEKIAEAVASALNLAYSVDAPATAQSTSDTSSRSGTFATQLRAWQLRPGAHIDETGTERFWVGAVNQSRPDRAEAAGLESSATLYVRLFPGSSPEGRYVPALVSGETASFFETVFRDTVQIEAKLRLAAVTEEGDNVVPLIVIDSFNSCC